MFVKMNVVYAKQHQAAKLSHTTAAKLFKKLTKFVVKWVIWYARQKNDSSRP